MSLRRDTVAATLVQVLGLASSMSVFLLFRLRLGIPEYGVYSALQGIVYVVVLLSTSWVSPLILQMSFRDKLTRPEILRRTLTLSILMAIAGAVALVGLSLVLLPGRSLVLIGLLFLAEIVTQLLVGAAAAFLQVSEGFVAASVMRGVPMAVRLGVCAMLLATDGNFRGFVYLLAASMGAVAVGTLVFAWLRIRSLPSFDQPERADVTSGLSYASSSVLYAIQDDFDKVLMSRSRPELEAGQYATGYRVYQMLLYPVTALIAATHTRLLEAADAPAATYRTARRFAGLAVAYTAAVAAGGLALAGPLADLIKSDAEMLRVLCFIGLAKSAADFALNSLIGLGRNWIRTMLVAIAAGFNLVGNLVFIPHFGWQAAAVTTIVSDGLLTVAAWLFLRHFMARTAPSATGQRGDPDLGSVDR